MRPRWFWLLASPLVLLIAGWGVFGYYSSQEKRYRADLGQAKSDLAAGRLVAARARLADLAARRPADGEAAYYLGRCEAGTQRHRGRPGGVGPSARRLTVRDPGRGGSRRRRCSTPASFAARPRRFSRPCRADKDPTPPRSDRPSSWSTGSRGGWTTSAV